jgi:hypothetical protein
MMTTKGSDKITITVDYNDSCVVRNVLESYAKLVREFGPAFDAPYADQIQGIHDYINRQVLEQVEL